MENKNNDKNRMISSWRNEMASSDWWFVLSPDRVKMLIWIKFKGEVLQKKNQAEKTGEID